MSNFLLAVVSDIGQVYPKLWGLFNHPFFEDGTGQPSMRRRNKFVRVGMKLLKKIITALTEYGTTYENTRKRNEQEEEEDAAQAKNRRATALSRRPVQLNLVCYLLQQKMASPKCILVCICYSCCTGLTPPLPFACHACQQRRRHT